jgi:DNA-binding NtrC family response regulator
VHSTWAGGDPAGRRSGGSQGSDLERGLHSALDVMVASSHHPSPPRPLSAAEAASIETLFARFLEGATHRNGGTPPSLRDWVDLAEAWRIAHALRECRGNRSAAARLLGIGRRTLYTKMEKFGIEPTYSTWPVDRSHDAA